MSNRIELIRELQKEVMQEREDLTCGEQRDVVVYINHSLDEYDISLVQQIESYLDEALALVGFTRSNTTKGDIQELVYWQYAKALKKRMKVNPMIL